MPNDLFWSLTPAEVTAVFEVWHAKERGAYMRAGLIAATIANVNRPKGTRALRPQDFIREAPRPEDYMDLEEAASMMDRWAASTNESLRQNGVELPVAGIES